MHVVTINDYLARRDAEWMGPLLEAMGLTVGWVTADSTPDERRAAYKCDVTYASVNEIGFDVLRDQLVTDVDDLVSPNPDVALIDEADSVLVDEALVPLVLAGTSHRETPKLEIIRLVGELIAGDDYDTDSDSRNVHLTETGAQKLEAKLGGIDLYSEEHVGTTLTEVNVALHAHVLLHRDVHYIVRDDAVQLINATRGRIAQLQRWPDGLQAAVEAKEGIETTETGEVLDTITVQALINRYPTVCGMTGTALAAGEQLRQFYKLGVSPIPPNTPNIREDEPDRVYITAAAKNDGDRRAHRRGARDQAADPGRHPRRRRVRGAARAAGQGGRARGRAQRQERRRGGRVIAEAGKLGAVTVSTQMAGRGTDIRLGGSDEADHDEVAELGGLHVIGTGRHDTERLDNQLRGRAGRQGDPGSSVFFASWEDDVVRRPPRAGEAEQAAERDRRRRPRSSTRRPAGLLDHAQRVAEGRLLDVHANTWRYNQLIAQQRAILVERRNTLLRTPTAREELAKLSPDRYEELAENAQRGAAGEDLPADHAVSTSTAAGPITWPTWPTSARASTCVRWARQNPLDEFHRMAVDAFASSGRRRDRGRTADLRDRERARGGAGPRPVQAGPADLDVDVHGARQPALTTTPCRR